MVLRCMLFLNLLRFLNFIFLLQPFTLPFKHFGFLSLFRISLNLSFVNLFVVGNGNFGLFRSLDMSLGRLLWCLVRSIHSLLLCLNNFWLIKLLIALILFVILFELSLALELYLFFSSGHLRLIYRLFLHRLWIGNNLRFF